MKIVVDADACPVKDVIVDISAELGLPLLMVASLSHTIDVPEGVGVVTVDSSYQATDMAIINRAQAGDVVVTDDYGLASLSLGKGAHPISYRGRLFTHENIGPLLEARHLKSKERRAGLKSRGPRRFSPEDKRAFSSNLRALLIRIIGEKG